MRAAVRGIIDFREARLLDPDWWNRCQVLLRELAREDEVTLQRQQMAFHLALVANSGLDDDGFKRAQEQARESFFDLMGMLRPWEGVSYQERKQGEYTGLREAYVQAFGDPNDPEFQKQEAEALRRFEAIIASRPSETDLERVQRLRAEQATRLQQLQEERRRNRHGR